MKTTLEKIWHVLNFLKLRIFAVVVSAAVLTVTVYAATAQDVGAEAAADGAVSSSSQTETELQTEESIDVSTKEISEESSAESAEDSAAESGAEGIDVTEKKLAEESAKPVMMKITIVADGVNHQISIDGGVVRDALKKAGVTVDGDDLLNYELDTLLDDGDEIIVERVEYGTVEEEEAVPFEVVEKQTPLLKPGKSELLQEGEDGKVVRTYTQKTIDGAVEESTLVSEIVEVTPKSEVTLVYGEVPISDLDFEGEIADNAPTEYTKVIKNARATGYSAGRGAWGASGNHLFYGHVAVNPNVIPYDSKLYITSEDGKFVYGYAIASDTGTALMNGVIDVDLYYETFRESQLNGVRRVNVYVLE